MQKRLSSFVSKHNILYSRQYGFRPKRSTIDALTDFTSDLLSSLDKKEECLAVYLDLSKAFDTINHRILLGKLNKLWNPWEGLGLVQKLSEPETTVRKIQWCEFWDTGDGIWCTSRVSSGATLVHSLLKRYTSFTETYQVHIIC